MTIILDSPRTATLSSSVVSTSARGILICTEKVLCELCFVPTLEIFRTIIYILMYTLNIKH